MAVPSSSTAPPPSGALAPAARIATQIRPPPAPTPQRPASAASNLSTASSEGAGTSRPAESKQRRNPKLSLHLDQRLRGTESYSLPGTSETDSSPNDRLSELGRGTTGRSVEATPSLTPGHLPVWDRTPGPVPVTQVSHRGSVTMPSRPPLPRGASTSQVGPSFSVVSIRAHIRHRLGAAKEGCDRELRKIIHGIDVYAERELKAERNIPPLELTDEASPVAYVTPDENMSTAVSDVDTGVESDVTGNDGGDESDRGLDRTGSWRRVHSASGLPGVIQTDLPPRSGALSPASPYAMSAPVSAATSPTMLPTHLPSTRRTSMANRGRPPKLPDGTKSPRRFSAKQRGAPPRYGEIVAALGRSVSQATSASNSAPSSRSTSRSRSPLPPLGGPGGLVSQRVASSEQASRQAADPPTQPSAFIATLQEIIAIASEVLDTSVTALTAYPNHCAELIQRVQHVGKAWDANPEWPCRGWYVQLLLTVAGLSRVVEWWEAEKGFWKFDDKDESGDSEPIIFVAKPHVHEDDHPALARVKRSSKSSSASRSRAPSVTVSISSQMGEPVPGPEDADIGDRAMPLPSTSPTVSVSIPPGSPEHAKVETEDFKTAVEQVRIATILMELDLDEQRFQHLSPVWLDVVG